MEAFEDSKTGPEGETATFTRCILRTLTFRPISSLEGAGEFDLTLKAILFYAFIFLFFTCIAVNEVIPFKALYAHLTLYEIFSVSFSIFFVRFFLFLVIHLSTFSIVYLVIVKVILRKKGLFLRAFNLLLFSQVYLYLAFLVASILDPLHCIAYIFKKLNVEITLGVEEDVGRNTRIMAVKRRLNEGFREFKNTVHLPENEILWFNSMAYSCLLITLAILVVNMKKTKS